MCGIIGVYLEHVTPIQLEKITKLVHESAIRGIHATGISYLQNKKIITIKDHKAGYNFPQVCNIVDRMNYDGGLYMIAHTRYSTSDLRYNQPIGDEEHVIAHNGVISQANHKVWKKLFGLTTETSNDSELIWACIHTGTHPFKMFKGSMAVCVLNKNKIMNFFRNDQRPLWFQQELNGVVVASTKDILLRSGFSEPKKCNMFTNYIMREGTLTSQLYETPEGIVDLQ